MRRTHGAWLATLTLTAGTCALLLSARGPATPARLRIPRVDPGSPRVAATFSHLRHGQLACHDCHPTLFPKALVGFTHDDMRQGRFCGACHDGQSARAVEKLSCEVCHVAD